MCGVAGVLQFDKQAVVKSVLKDMTDSIAHRGPDGEGQWVEEYIGLGHRRLAIIDLTDFAHQPMVSKSSRYVLTYNGEIYNFQEIRKELELEGRTFVSTSDTEVLLQSYEHWGESAIEKFNGMFAFAVWDREKKELFLARDRYGIKPLYYAFAKGSFVFGSEAKAILKHPDVDNELDLETTLEYFTFQNIFTDNTLMKQVKMVPAGHYMVVKHNGESMMHEYWDYDFHEPSVSHSEDEYIEELDFLFRRAVKRQLVSDVDVGSYLSGGMDSGSITAIASQNVPYMRTFTCGFDLSSASGLELNFDERQEAERMSYNFKTEHYEMVLKAGDMERCLPKLAYHIEEPRVGQSYPNYYAAHLASKFNKVVLAGTGGDEIFGGYPWRYYRAVVNNDFDQYVDKYYNYWQRLIPNKTIHSIFSPVADKVDNVWTRDIFANVFKHHASQFDRPEDYINHSLYFEAKTFLHGLLMVEDKLSMAHSLETRVPFLDNDLVDFAMQLPTRMKLGKLGDVVRLNENEPGEKTAKYFQKTKDGKLLLRKMMERHVPSEVINREKQGFSAPDASWFKGESIEYVKNQLFNDNAKIYQVMDKGSIQNLVSEHLDGKTNRRLLIWSLLNFESFLDQYT